MVKSPGYSLGSSVLCVAEKEAVHINDYMKALHQRFYREPDFSEMDFKLAWGLSKELEADGLYSFDEEETERVCRQAGKEE